MSVEDTVHFTVQICSLVAKNYHTNFTEKSLVNPDVMKLTRCFARVGNKKKKLMQ